MSRAARGTLSGASSVCASMPARQRSTRGSRNAAISSPLRTSRMSPTSTGWFQVLPSIAVKRATSENLSGVADDERQLAFLRQHQQHVLIRQEYELSVAVASALPFPRFRRRDRRTRGCCRRSRRHPLVNDEVTEIRFQSARRPALLDGPPDLSRAERGSCARPRCGACRPRPWRRCVMSSVAVLVGHSRLHDRRRPVPTCAPRAALPSAGATLIVRLPRSNRICGHAVDRRQMRRAVASAARWTQPPWFAGSGIVGDESAGGGDDHEVADDQRGAGEPPGRDLLTRVGRGIARPDDRAAAGVKRVDDSGRAERVDATVAERRRPARTGAGVRLPEAHRIAMLPHRLAGAHLVRRDHFIVHRAVPACREHPRRPRTRTNRVQSAGATTPPAATSDQSVSIRTPRTMASRSGPRNPGHSTRLSSGSLMAGPSARLNPGLLAAGSGVVAGTLASVGAVGAAGLSALVATGVLRNLRRSRPATALSDCLRPVPGGVARESASTAIGNRNR